MEAYLSKKLKIVSLLLMIMVVFLHSYNLDTKGLPASLIEHKGFNWFLQNFISYGLTRIAVPLFFLISGFLFLYDKNVAFQNLVFKIKKRIKTLLLPFLLWSFIGILFYYVIQLIPQTQSFFTNKSISEYSISDWADKLLFNPIPYQLWFLRDLFLLVILSPIIVFILTKVDYFFVVIILPFWFLNLNFFIQSESILFFSIGMLIAINDLKINIKTAMFKNGLLWLLLLFLTICFKYFNQEVLSVFTFKVSILVGIVSFWYLYDYFFLKFPIVFTKIEKITWATFFIFLAHEPILTIVKKGLFFVMGKSQTTIFIIYLLTPIFTVFVCLLFGKFLLRVSNKSFFILTGGRN
ncbi:acyltransferase family protein [Flavobacterium sp.]|uniref:acyltransferase family protein n=1 Tax=Flavobacterium sp. TaxID=239 RepID=UPI00352829C3